MSDERRRLAEDIAACDVEYGGTLDTVGASDRILAALRAERELAIEEACKAVCSGCMEGREMFRCPCGCEDDWWHKGGASCRSVPIRRALGEK